MLLQDGRPAVVSPRGFDLLVALVERAGSLVTKDELLERVWRNVVVEENNLQVQVSALRKVLGSEAIATVAGHGYRFEHAVAAIETNPAPADARPQGLPHFATTFIGRDDELREGARLLKETRLLTLVGVGGVGKTRLAIELAASVAEHFPDGVAFVDLAPVEDPRSVVGTIASALTVMPDPARSLVDSLLQHVAGCRLLLVLDNCEHLLQACAAISMQLLRSSEGLTLLATSREPLRMAEEAVYRVAGMPAPQTSAGMAVEALREFAAVALFVDRASAMDRGFVLTADNAVHIARICQQLDGIPLALELAASRVRAMSVRTIAEHLTEQFRLLVGGDRAALPRQQTLRATLDWGHRLLTDPERSLFRRLSVFAGGFELDAAEAVGIGDDVHAGDVLYLLAELVDKSLVTFYSQRSRYRLLEPVRQYALERLEDVGETSDTRDRHLRFHLEFAEILERGIRTARQPELIARIDAERDNIVSAFAHAHEMADGGPAGLKLVYPLLTALSIIGHIDLSLRLAREALAHPGAQEESVARCRALYVTAFIDFAAGRYAEARETSDQSVRIARKCNDRLALAEALYRLGHASLSLGKVDKARECFVEQVELATAVGDLRVLSDAHAGLGELLSMEGQLELAQQHYLDALACNPDEADGAATSNFNLARNSITLGSEATAVRHLRNALASLGGIRRPAYARSALYLCAGIATMRKDLQRALRLFGAAAAHQERSGVRNPEPDNSQCESWLQLARDAAGKAASDDAFAAGTAISDDEALAEAIAWLESLPRA